MNSQISQRAALLLLSSIAALPAWAQVSNFTGATSDRFGIADNWDNGIPNATVAGVVDSRRVEIPTQNEMVVGATIDFNGTSSLDRNSTAQAAFSGVININDSTNVKISSWWPEQNSVLNWNSSGTFSLADSGPSNQGRLYVQALRDNAVVNINDGFWDMRGDTSAFSVRLFSGTINMNGGLMIADKAFNLGAGFANSSATVNYSSNAEIRTKTIGVFVQSVFNFEAGAKLYVESGLLGSFGDDGITWLRDMLRQTDARGIYIDGVRQTIGATEGLDASNFSTATVQLDGIWYNELTAVPEPATVTAVLGVLALAAVLHRRRPARLQGPRIR